MAVRRHRPVDAVTIGVGWTGGILAAELTKAGMTVLGLERGHQRGTEDFSDDHDELRYAIRSELFQNTAEETWTLRHRQGERALPIRRLGSFLPGIGLGGAGVHWNGQTWRFHPRDFTYRTTAEEVYGDRIPSDMTIRDWGITYDELEPYFDRFEYMAGIAGKAGNLSGRRVEGGNVFEGPRRRDYPVRPMDRSLAGHLFEQAAREHGYHPFPLPSANLPEVYTNPAGITRHHCTYCGYCERFGCEVGAKADPTVTVIPEAQRTGRYEIRYGANVTRILHDGRRATGVRYVDAAGREHEQPAEMVLLTAFTFNNVRLLLLSEMGEVYDPATGRGAVGRNYTYQNNGASAVGFWRDEDFRPYMGSGANGVSIDDLDAENFDHDGLDFLGGGLVTVASLGVRPILGLTVPEGTPGWGARWKRAIRQYYRGTVTMAMQAESPAYRQHHLDLDPTYRDRNGDPLLRITFDWQPNERKLAEYVGRKMKPLMESMGADEVVGGPGSLPPHYDVQPYQSTHNNGGAIMGAEPGESVVNRWLQMWDYDNVFVVGASAFPQNASFNPTGTVGALAYRAADGIVNRYRHRPGPLA
ncbi:MAG TPA: GMC family oxidoreductase [Conexibacter sp.]|nr:GMC family oxidoreductase [Conexibacter sp.]